MKLNEKPATHLLLICRFTWIIFKWLLYSQRDTLDYEYQMVFIIWIGTHKEYDKIDVKTVEYDE